MLWYGWRGREIGYNCYKCKHIWNYVTRLNLLAQTQVSVASLAELANVVEKLLDGFIIPELSWLDFKPLNWCGEALAPGPIF
ncbi:hypothetical protein GGP41_001628 [Bipolaris sorokiniana]|uniref:Uncharacterized protein n=1 Tax=Cochliobolus sativus TaxID=45130 RepID=A0A8H5ZQ00_COCSA|nr:hypothetical protein GGP41_001628 [Bipolaris sorokiniana]